MSDSSRFNEFDDCRQRAAVTYALDRATSSTGFYAMAHLMGVDQKNSQFSPVTHFISHHYTHSCSCSANDLNPINVLPLLVPSSAKCTPSALLPGTQAHAHSRPLDHSTGEPQDS